MDQGTGQAYCGEENGYGGCGASGDYHDGGFMGGERYDVDAAGVEAGADG